MTTRPACRYCGRPIPKRTTHKYFAEESAPKTKNQAQRLVNHQIVSVRRWGHGAHTYIGSVGLWDGESYGVFGQTLFCTKNCGWKYALRHAAK